MQCSLDSGLVVVVFIVGCLLWVVGLLLFYEFEDVCDKIRFRANDSNMVMNYFTSSKLTVSLDDWADSYRNDRTETDLDN